MTAMNATHTARTVADLAAALDAQLAAAQEADDLHQIDGASVRAGVAAYLASMADAPEGKIWTVHVSAYVGGLRLANTPFAQTGQGINIACTLEDNIPPELLAQVGG